MREYKVPGMYITTYNNRMSYIQCRHPRSCCTATAGRGLVYHLLQVRRSEHGGKQHYVPISLKHVLYLHVELSTTYIQVVSTVKISQYVVVSISLEYVLDLHVDFSTTDKCWARWIYQYRYRIDRLAFWVMGGVLTKAGCCRTCLFLPQKIRARDY